MDYYSILGVNRNATPDEIRKAYRDKAKTHHPDRGGDPEKFKQINEAYETLSDTNKKAEYDNPQPQFHFNTGNFDDIFSVFFGNAQSIRKNRDLKIAVVISLEEVASGKDVILNYTTLNGKSTTSTIRIHPGVENGEIIRFRHLGDDSVPNLPKGDLLVQIKILNHDTFERDGKNLRISTQINVIDLIIGTKIEILTLDKTRISVNVPAGTQPGTVLSVSKHGLPDKMTGQIGNLYITIKGYTPKIIKKSILEKLEYIKNEIDTGA